jgi:hypothetical protein
MRKYVTILGTLLIATILYSGSAVATWIYAGSVYSSTDCENPEDALGEPDGEWATIGTSDPIPACGNLILDFGASGIPNFETLWVIGQGTGEDEDYQIFVYQEDFGKYWGPRTRSDQGNEDFALSDADPGHKWQYVLFYGVNGQTGPGDPIYGPEIDAVRFDL